MKTRRWIVLVAALAGLGAHTVLAAGPGQEAAPSYFQHIAPLFKKYCVACHNESELKGGLVLATYDDLVLGGNSGDVIVPGQSAESLMVLLLEGQQEPKMPPEDAPQPTPEEIALIKAWIDAGAQGPSAMPSPAPVSASVAPLTPTLPEVPEVRPAIPVQPAVNAVTWHPNGRLLAVGRYQEVLILDAAEGQPVGRVSGMVQDVSAIEFSRDGKRLAVAGGAPGQFGQMLVAEVPDSPMAPVGSSGPVADWEVLRTWYGHDDAVYSAALSPDGKHLATASYDQHVKIWDATTGQEKATLKDHTGAVYTVAFSPDGGLLASGAGDSAVKVWDVASGERLYTLADSLDYVYSIAFHPGGRQLAAGGADKRIRIWNVSRSGGSLAGSAFAHGGAVLRIAYSSDGRWLYSSGEDRRLKIWQADPLMEKQVLEPQPDWASALAVSERPWEEGEQTVLAVGRHNGSIVLYDAATGEHVRDLLGSSLTVVARADNVSSGAALAADAVPTTEASEDSGGLQRPVAAPKLESIWPHGLVRGSTVRFTLKGKNLAGADAIFFDTDQLTGRSIPAEDSSDSRQLTIEVTAAAETKPGIYQVYVHAPLGTSGSLPLVVDALAEVAEEKENHSAENAQLVTLPATIIGAIEEVGEADRYAFAAQAGQELVFEVAASPLGSPLNAVLTLTDAEGQELATVDDYYNQLDSLLVYRFIESGKYVIRISDLEYRGGRDYHYRLRIGPLTYITDVFPMGVPQGATTEVTLEGANLPSRKLVVEVPESAAPGSRVPLPVTSPLGVVLGRTEVVVGEFTEMFEEEPNDDHSSAPVISVPVTINGHIFHGTLDAQSQGQEASSPSESGKTIATSYASASGDSSDVDCFRLEVRKGRWLAIEVEAARLGSPLDPFVEVLDTGGEPVPRATLRAVSEMFTSVKEHGSRLPSMRLEAWPDLGVDDYVMVGGELLQVERMPAGPDEDVFFKSFRGQRLGMLGTTPEAHALGVAVYKVHISPPGATFPPNGLPVFHIAYRNDDGGPLYASDSILLFDPPADGLYTVRIRDVRELEDPHFSYRLTIREARPNYQLAVMPMNPNVPFGGSIPITVEAERHDGYEGPIDVWLEDLPSGFSATRGQIAQGDFTTTVVLSLDKTAAMEPGRYDGPIRVMGQAQIDGREVIQETQMRWVSVVPDPDIRVWLEPAEVVLAPGQSKWLTVHIDRRYGYDRRVPIEFRNLPDGVRVLDVGLNGVLITPQETSRQIELYAEPWAPEVKHTFYASAREETDPPSEHVSPPIQLKVVPPTTVAQQSEQAQN